MPAAKMSIYTHLSVLQKLRARRLLAKTDAERTHLARLIGIYERLYT